MHDRMHSQGQILMLMIEEITEVLFDLVFQDQRRRDLTGPITGRTDLLGIDRHFRASSADG